MHIIVYVKKHYDWEPIPKGVVVTEADVKAKRVKPGVSGEMLMRVTKDVETETDVRLPESDLIDMIIWDAVKEHVSLTRAQAAGLWLSRHVMPEHAHRSHMEDFEVVDEGADLALFEKKIDEHIATGKIEADDRPGLMAAYQQPLDHKHHRGHLHKHFGVSDTGHRSKRSKAARKGEAQ